VTESALVTDDFACIFERVVRRFDLLGAVVVTNDLVSDTFDAQLMPFAGSDFEIRAGKLSPLLLITWYSR